MNVLIGIVSVLSGSGLLVLLLMLMSNVDWQTWAAIAISLTILAVSLAM